MMTKDSRLVTDSELGVGGECNLLNEGDQPLKLTDYMGWLVTPMWADTVQGWSGDAVWYAALRRDPASPESGTIVAFVQSKYLKIQE